MIEHNVKPYSPSKEVADRIHKVYSDYQHTRNLRDQEFEEFDGKTPEVYWEESRKRVKNYLPPLSLETELSNMFLGKTRNKRNVIAGFVAAQRPQVEIDVRGGVDTPKNDKRLSVLLNTAYDFFMAKEDSDEKYLDWSIEALDVGTGHLMEDYDFYKRTVKIVKDEDFATGKKTIVKQDRIERDQCAARIIPIEDIFIPDFYQPDIQLQPYIVIREMMSRVLFMERYGKYPDAKYVPHGRPNEDKEDDTFFYELLEDRLEDQEVEVLHHYRKWDDEHNITANGVLLTDLENPIKYDHKQYPIAKSVYEKMGSSFYYGMSLPMKVYSEQDLYNELGNNNADRSNISSIPTAISSLESEIEQDYIGTYNILKVDNDTGLRELGFESVKAGDMEFMKFISDSIAESTVSDSFSGAIEGVTATEIMNARAQNQQNLGPFLTYVYTAAKHHAELRLSNIMQYFFMSSKKYDGKDFETRELTYKTKLQDGTDGIRVVRVMSNDKKKPSKKQRMDEMERGIEKHYDSSGAVIERTVEVNYDYIYVTPQEIADIEYVVTIVPNSTLPETQSLKKALALELAETMSTDALAPITDFNKIQEIIAEAFDKPIDDIRLEQDATEQIDVQEAQQMQAMGGMGQGMGRGGAPSDLVQGMTQTSTAGIPELMAG